MRREGAGQGPGSRRRGWESRRPWWGRSGQLGLEGSEQQDGVHPAQQGVGPSGDPGTVLDGRPSDTQPLRLTAGEGESAPAPCGMRTWLEGGWHEARR